MKQERLTINGSDKNRIQPDLLTGNLWYKVPQFAVPVAATAMLEQLFNASDIAVVGNFTGAECTIAVAAVGANSPIVALVVNLFVGIALGSNVVIAHAIGQGKANVAQRAVHTSIAISIWGGIAVALLGELSADWLLELLNVPQDVFPLALRYLRIYLAGVPVILLYNFEAAIFRAVGETKAPLVALGISGILNVFMNLFLVAVLELSVTGVAIATVIANAVSSILLYRKLRSTVPILRLEPCKLRIDGSILAQILRIGLPAGLQSAVFSISNIVVQSAINSLGTVVMAASSAAFNIEMFTYDILNSFSQACTTFVGQNFGAGKLRRCRHTLSICIAEGCVTLMLAILSVLIFGRPLLAMFNGDPKVVATGYVRLMMVMLSHFFSLFYEVMSGYLRGFGISLAPALLTMLGVCGIRVAWVHFMFPHSRTFRTIMAAYPISLTATALLMLIALLYYRPARRNQKNHLPHGKEVASTKNRR